VQSSEVGVFARVSHVRYPPQHYDAGLRVVVEDLLPALRRAPGYRGCCLLSGGKPGTGLAVVLWESEEAADAAANDRAVAAAHVALAALGMAIEERKIYEVVARDAGGPDLARAAGVIPSL
jgi:heme-degrading monooxygenase HmoA